MTDLETKLKGLIKKWRNSALTTKDPGFLVIYKSHAADLEALLPAETQPSVQAEGQAPSVGTCTIGENYMHMQPPQAASGGALDAALVHEVKDALRRHDFSSADPKINWWANRCEELVNALASHDQKVRREPGIDWVAQNKLAQAAEKRDCEKALLALAGWYPTPVEGYGFNTSWAISDLCRAIAKLRPAPAGEVPVSKPVKMQVRYCGHEVPVGEICSECYPHAAR